MKLAAFLASQARAFPDKPAVVCGEASVTFRQLHDDSDRIATAMRRQGIMIGDRVAMCLPNCCEFVTIFFAIIKSGAIAMPINMRLSANEIDAIFKDAAPAAVFFGVDERENIARIIGDGTIRSFVIGDTSAPAEVSLKTMLESEPEPIEVPTELDDCVISYTSGTTGRPKGVITTQANYIVANGFLNAMHWHLVGR